MVRNSSRILASVASGLFLGIFTGGCLAPEADATAEVQAPVQAVPPCSSRSRAPACDIVIGTLNVSGAPRSLDQYNWWQRNDGITPFLHIASQIGSGLDLLGVQGSNGQITWHLEAATKSLVEHDQARLMREVESQAGATTMYGSNVGAGTPRQEALELDGRALVTWLRFRRGAPVNFFSIDLEHVAEAKRLDAMVLALKYVQLHSAEPPEDPLVAHDYVPFVAASLGDVEGSAVYRVMTDAGWVDGHRAALPDAPASSMGTTPLPAVVPPRGAQPSRRTDFVFARASTEVLSAERFMVAPTKGGLYDTEHFGVKVTYRVRF